MNQHNQREEWEIGLDSITDRLPAYPFEEDTILLVETCAKLRVYVRDLLRQRDEELIKKIDTFYCSVPDKPSAPFASDLNIEMKNLRRVPKLEPISCKNCHVTFQPRRSVSGFCSKSCAATYFNLNFRDYEHQKK